MYHSYRASTRLAEKGLVLLRTFCQHDSQSDRGPAPRSLVDILDGGDGFRPGVSRTEDWECRRCLSIPGRLLNHDSGWKGVNILGMGFPKHATSQARCYFESHSSPVPSLLPMTER
jgi:hypothetical protein